MNDHLIFFVSLLLASYLFAKTEIHIEDERGWAENLPTWKIQNRWTRLFLGAKPLTGYHLHMFAFIFVLTHLSHAFSFAAHTLSHEMRILTFFALFCVIQDFFWFLFNPAFGLHRFRREAIWWHKAQWSWLMPRE